MSLCHHLKGCQSGFGRGKIQSHKVGGEVIFIHSANVRGHDTLSIMPGIDR